MSRDGITSLIVAVGLVVTLAAITAALIFLRVPDGNEQALLLLIGALTANVGSVVGYFFGSSSSSRNKDDTIASLTTKGSP
ncbi:MAG: hypothetical protein JSS44_08995 [Proteobacteria bacterium]|nr:hypothetical protein [Pseudomonadota bacterium]MBS0499373.1 hypothetical protein [Pseudomonadota bacterium]